MAHAAFVRVVFGQAQYPAFRKSKPNHSVQEEIANIKLFQNFDGRDLVILFQNIKNVDARNVELSIACCEGMGDKG
ncbi:hypothetical protein [Sulfitobacter sp. F26169L]|uniref:hypothetical protein n=1 Tax=Sulfitobacter sp. F26169L TaxID=2996015 RepID=UPI002260C7C1|nr:hypothetical protein [Sulfitobacter sp. F26169L]